MSFLLLLKNIITIEPAVGLVRFGIGQIEGGQIQSDLLLWKICHLELNYTEEICGNLTLDEYDLINNEVQAKAKLREKFTANAHIKDARVIDMMVIKVSSNLPN